jgi:hypothetical protein
MVRERYVKEGPSKQHYGLSSAKNKEIDSRRQSLAYSQSKNTKRDKLGSEVSREGGKVYWEKEEQEKELVFPYTRAEHDKLKLREEKVASRMKELKDKYSLRGIDDLTRAYDINDFLTGKAHFKVNYTAGGQLSVERIKDGTSGKVYTLTEANGFLRNLERYANQIEKVESFKKRHGDKSKLEATASAVMAILGVGLGAVFLSNNITGNVVAESLTSNVSILGGVLIVIGIIGAFFYFRRKK